MTLNHHTYIYSDFVLNYYINLLIGAAMALQCVSFSRQAADHFGRVIYLSHDLNEVPKPQAMILEFRRKA